MATKVNMLESGIYTVSDASRLIRTSEQKLRGWISGYPRRGEPILKNELGWLDGRLAFSFANLMEMRFLAFFATEGIHLNSLRFMVAEARKVLRHPHPFATNVVFRTDGRRVYADILQRSGETRLYNLYARNYEMGAVIERTLKAEVIYDPRGEAASWLPRPELAPNIIVHPKLAFGQPTLRGSGVPVRALLDALNAGETVSAVANWFEVPEQQVREAEAFDRDLARAA
jgi:uncharacterized protein (DUF433 family)